MILKRIDAATGSSQTSKRTHPGLAVALKPGEWRKRDAPRTRNARLLKLNLAKTGVGDLMREVQLAANIAQKKQQPYRTRITAKTLRNEGR